MRSIHLQNKIASAAADAPFREASTSSKRKLIYTL